MGNVEAIASISADMDAMFSSGPETSAAETTASPEPVQTSAAEPAAPVTPSDSSAPKPIAEPVAAEPVAAAKATETAPPDAAAPATEENPLLEPDELALAAEEFKDAKGAEWVKYPKARHLEVFGGFKASRELAQAVTGRQEPLTPDLVKEIVADRQMLDRIDFDVMSDAPEEQARAFSYLFNRATKAFQGGHAKHNPQATMADAIVTAARSQAPEVLQGLESHFQRQTIESMYDRAIKMGHQVGQPGETLFNATQNLDQALTGKYLSRKDAKPVDPNLERERTLAAREQEIQRRDQAIATEKWDGWLQGTRQAITGAVDAEIEALLKPLAASLNGEAKKQVVVRLHQEVKDAIAADQAFREKRQQEYRQAGIAATERVRDDWRANIASQFAARAKQVIRAKAQPILAAHAQVVKSASDAQHGRLANSQTKVGTPNGGPVNGQPSAASTGPMNNAQYHKELAELWG